MQILSYSPGQVATVFLEVTDGYSNVRVDSVITPYVYRLILPDLSFADGYPQTMTRLDLGLYVYSFTLPRGGSALGSYLLDIRYQNPFNFGGNSGDDESYAAYQILVNSPYGAFGNYVASVQSTV